MGGGAIYDLGPYAIAAGLWATNFAEVGNVRAQVIKNEHGVDFTTAVSFTAGTAVAKSLVSMATHGTDTLEILGTTGRILLPGNRAFMTRHVESSLLIEDNNGIRVEHFDSCDPYQLMLDATSERIQGQSSWVMPLSESLAFAKLFDQIFATTL
jgi:predicted dehydrogenase